ncbi:MAG: RNA polymerase sigma factor [Ruthenibacterium lactatiformans]
MLRRLHRRAALLRNDPQEGLQADGIVRVHAICTAILRGHAEDADEAAADTFVRLWRNASSLPAGTALRGYVVRTARSCAIDRYRALTRRGVLFPLDGREEDMDFAVELESLLETRELAGMILALPPPDGEIFLRRYLYCEETRAIAEHYGLPDATVRTKLARARKKLRALLEKEVSL